MPYQLPKQQFHRDQFITLNEGFDRTGRFMFPEEWTGQEAFAWSETASQNLNDQREALLKTCEHHSRRVRKLKTVDTFGASVAECRENDQLLERAEALRREAREELGQFGRTYDSRHYDALAFERRKAVEKCLCKVIRNQDLNVHMGHGFFVKMEEWFESDRFHMSFAFSIVAAPIRFGNRRRFPAYFHKQAFNAWAYPFEVTLKQYRTDGLGDQMIDWFLAFRAECIANSNKPKQADARKLCETYFDRKGLGESFKAVWKLLAPEEWKQGGRPSKNP